MRFGVKTDARDIEDAIAGGQASEQASAAGRSPQPLVHDTGHAAAPRAPERPREIPARLEGKVLFAVASSRSKEGS